MTKLPFDEISELGRERITLESLEKAKATNSTEELEDDVIDLLLMAYAFGVDNCNESLGTDVEANIEKIETALNEKQGGKNWRDRVLLYATALALGELYNAIDTDVHRLYETAQNDVAEEVATSGKNIYKVWKGVMDDREREKHVLLEGVKVPLDGRFYIENDSAPCPARFSLPENNVNCRCTVFYSAE